MQVFKLFLSTFKRLNLVTILHKHILIIHGGLPRTKALPEDVNLLPWTEHSGMMGVHKFASKGERMQADTFNDLLWSDPIEKDGFVAEERCRAPGR